jgi:hypothetical protein
MAGAPRHCQPAPWTLLATGLAGGAGSIRSRTMAKDDKDRAERLAAALRENLRRRKAQARDAAATKGAKPD